MILQLFMNHAQSQGQQIVVSPNGGVMLVPQTATAAPSSGVPASTGVAVTTDADGNLVGGSPSQ
eukprot:CAMPEP_0118990360 /NCGR_PEP_ID=MMETSP1173-20130426/49772_1 /TAXON_ID=1034831 /ORGANISM="Rhizochromulina marina cf, Strain CCMP1243" /LENGTH=63 /DNA_ID=CAMNT_0006941411 /DNA_START=35 /DNA_END=223 /DNA_ORIENTATION=+